MLIKLTISLMDTLLLLSSTVSYNRVPEGQNFATLDAGGSALPSDCYLQLAGRATFAPNGAWSRTALTADHAALMVQAPTTITKTDAPKKTLASNELRNTESQREWTR
jgi:hypothetical protein